MVKIILTEEYEYGRNVATVDADSAEQDDDQITFYKGNEPAAVFARNRVVGYIWEEVRYGL